MGAGNDRCRRDAATEVLGGNSTRDGPFRNARAQTRVGPAAIEMLRPFPKPPRMSLAHRNHEVQTLAPNRADQALTEGIRLRRASWR